MTTADLKSAFGDVSIGKDTSNKFKFSLKGLAVQISENSFRTYDSKKEELNDAITFDLGGSSNLIFRVPVPVNQLKKGEIIVAKENPFTAYFVREDPAKGAKSVEVISPDGISSVYSPSTSMLSPSGPPFVVKVTSLMGGPGTEFALEKLLPFLVLGDRGGNGATGDDLFTTLALANSLGIGGSKGLLGGSDSSPLALLALGGRSNLGALAALTMASAASNQPSATATATPKKK